MEQNDNYTRISEWDASDDQIKQAIDQAQNETDALLTKLNRLQESYSKKREFIQHLNTILEARRRMQKDKGQSVTTSKDPTELSEEVTQEMIQESDN